ncbi:MurR/RpiR family transcriptional regulator [Cytobacillus sp. FJAT-54145]|uniref:MurR/RpiR family transcriptional regulator n=1 Tax=Cytobacillus spartinae TaxID=3299023 RepID=A0ABW6KAI2_9BACI
MEQLIYTLLAYLNNSLKKDINYDIAQSLLEHIHDLEHFSLESVSEACHVAPSTINRFCKRIGFKNFSYLRNSVTLTSQLPTHEDELSSQNFVHQLNENLTYIDEIPTDQIDRIVKLLYQSRRIVILGFEKHQVQAMELQKKLFLLGKLCECGTNLYKQLDTLNDLSEEDLVITISIKGNILSESYPIMDKIKSAKGKKLLVTFSSELSTLDNFNEILLCGKLENSSVSSYTLLRLFDVIIYRYQRLMEK